MPPTVRFDPDLLARLESADVIFVAQDGFKLAPARVRCYGFATLLNQRGLRAEVLSFFDHLGAAGQGGAVDSVPVEDKLRLNVQACDILARNPRAVLYVQKTGYHALACMLAAVRGGNPIVLDYDDYDLDSHPFQEIEPLLPCLAPDRLLAALASRARAVVASSRRILDILRPYNPNAHLIHTVADQNLFSCEGRDRPRRRFGEKVNILWCGDVWGHVPMRDLFLATEAFAMVSRHIRDKARFHIIGFGQAWELTKERMRRRYAGICDLELHDFIPPSEMPDVFREMDIGVLPYHGNAFNLAKSPTKMFEYMLAKVTVLATPVGEVTQCLEHERSVLLAEDLPGLAHGLTRLIDDRALRDRLAAAAHERAMTEYSLQAVGDRLVAVIRAAAAPPPPDESAAGDKGLESFMEAALGRRFAIAPREIELARGDLRALAAAGDLANVPPRRWSAPLLAMLEWPGLSRREGISQDRLETLRLAGQQGRGAALLRERLGWTPPQRPQGPPRLCKFAAAEDWEDADWFGWLERFKSCCSSFRPAGFSFSHEAVPLDVIEQSNQTYNYFKRSKGSWERAQFLYGLDHLGLLTRTTRLLVATTDIDGFYLALTEYAGQVDVIDLGEEAPGRAAHVAAGEVDPWLFKMRPYEPDRLSIHHGPPGDDVFADRQWDAAVATQDTLARIGIAAFLDWITPRLRPNGVLAFSIMTGLETAGLESGAPFLPQRVADALTRDAGFIALDAFDASLSDSTLDRFAWAGSADAANPHFITLTGQGAFAPATWFFQRTAEREAKP